MGDSVTGFCMAICHGSGCPVPAASAAGATNARAMPAAASRDRSIRIGPMLARPHPRWKLGCRAPAACGRRQRPQCAFERNGSGAAISCVITARKALHFPTRRAACLTARLARVRNGPLGPPPRGRAARESGLEEGYDVVPLTMGLHGLGGGADGRGRRGRARKASSRTRSATGRCAARRRPARRASNARSSRTSWPRTGRT